MNKIGLPRENVFLRQLPKKRMSAKNVYFITNFIHFVHKGCQVLSTLVISVTVCIFTVSTFIFLTLTFPSPSLPFHNIPLSFPPMALDIPHFLKSFTVSFCEMHCHVIMIHID